MEAVTKILGTVLIVTAVYMGIKQGWAMASGKPEMLAMFERWKVGLIGVTIIGVITLISAVLMLFPKTFLWGNFLMAAGILLIICFHLQERNMKGALIELPFLLLSLVIIYVKHPLHTS